MGTEIRRGFPPIENVDTFLTIDKEVLRNIILHVQFVHVNPFLKKFSEGKHAFLFEMLVWNELIEILQIYDRTIFPCFFPIKRTLLKNFTDA